MRTTKVQEDWLIPTAIVRILGGYRALKQQLDRKTSDKNKLTVTYTYIVEYSRYLGRHNSVDGK